MRREDYPLPISGRFAGRSLPDTAPASRRSWSPSRAHGLVDAPSPRQGFWSPGPPVRACPKEPEGSPKFPSSPCADMPRASGRNTARATVGREFPSCTLSVCAAGSSFRHRSRVRKPPSHPGRSDVPSPVGSQCSACVISPQPSHRHGGLRARPHTPLIPMVCFAESPRRSAPTLPGPEACLGVILTGDHCTESPFASSGRYPSECHLACDLDRHAAILFAPMGACASPPPSRSLG
jgi:hypothetical protein